MLRPDLRSSGGFPLLREITPRPEQPPWGGEVQVRPVLDQQGRPRPAHAPQRPLPVRRQDRLQREALVLGAPGHPVVSRHRRLVAADGREEGFRGGHGL